MKMPFLILHGMQVYYHIRRINLEQVLKTMWNRRQLTTVDVQSFGYAKIVQQSIEKLLHTSCAIGKTCCRLDF